MNNIKENVVTHDKQEKKNIAKVPFEDLIPTDEVDISVYQQALEHAFKDDHLKNIAITGPYGAGKSSVLYSYLDKEKEIENKCLRISLAHLQPTKEGDPIDVATNETKENTAHQMEQLLEGKIINQILHQVNSDVVKEAGFRLIENEKCSIAYSLIVATTVGVLLAWGFSHVFVPPFIISSFLLPYIKELSILFYILIIVLIAGDVFLIYKNSQRIYSFFSQIHRVKVEGSEIELFQNADSTYFDKYLDHILYVLNHCHNDFLIFEDIDRFDTTLIFERLKEINELANAKREMNGQKPLKFIYLLRDDIFLNKERTKFFDFIIPIIPVTNTNNSADKLFDILDKYNLKKKVNPDLVYVLGLYIEDYRLIKNIANEFKIYSDALLEKNKLNPDKLLAMIVYKNVFPKDFVDLQKQKGYVHFLLSNVSKNRIRDYKRQELNKKKSELEKRIQDIDGEFLHDAKELVWAILGSNYKNSRNDINVSSYTSLSTLEDYIHNRNGISAEVEKEYNRRKEALEMKKDGWKGRCEQELGVINDELDNLCEASFSKLALMFTGNMETVFLQDEMDNNGEKIPFDLVRKNEYFNLLKYFLINGYLDETYKEYTTYFYGAFLSEKDQEFLMNLHENGNPKWDLALNNVSLVFKRISDAEFRYKGVLNYSLLHYMLFNSDNDTAEKIKIIMQSFHGEYFSYAVKFISKGEKVDEFAKCLFQVRPDSFRRIYVEKAVSPKEIEELVYATLLLLSEDEQKVLNEKSEGLFDSYISGNPDFFKKTGELDKDKVTVILSRLKLLGIQFPDIHAKDTPKDVLTAIFDNDLYVITDSMVLTLFSDVLDYFKEDAISKPLTLLKRMDEDNGIRTRLEKHFEQFVQAAIDNLHAYEIENFQDDVQVIIDFINQENLEDTAISGYLSRVKKEMVPNLKDVKEHRKWEKLIALDFPCHSDENLACYINEFGVDSACIEWLNTCFVHSPLISTDISKNEKEAIIDAIANRGDINIEVYISIFKTLEYTLSDSQSLKDDSFTKETIIRLVQEECLTVNKNVFDFLQSRYPELLIQYVKSDINEFEKMLTSSEVSFSSSGVGVFLSDHSIVDDKKELYINHTEGAISLLSHLDISDKLQSLILDYHLDANELPGIIEIYDTLGKKTQKALRRRVNEYVDNFIVVDAKKEEKLFYDIMHAESDMISNDAKVKILTANIPKLDIDEIQEMLQAINENTYGRILKLRTPRLIELEINHENEALLEALVKKQLLRSFETKNGGYEVERLSKKL